MYRKDFFLQPETAREVLTELLRTGAEFAEIYMESRTPTVLTWEDGRLDEASAGADRGVGLRVLCGETASYANGNDVDPAAISALARSLAASLPSSSTPGGAPLPFRPSTTPPTGVVRVPASTVPLADKVDVLRRADAAARAADQRIGQVTVTWIDTERRILVANSAGVFERDDACYLTLAVTAVARDGDQIRTGYEVASETSGMEMLEGSRPEEIAAEAARIALLQLSASPAPSGTFTVALSSKAGGTMIHEACGHGFEADFIEKGLSVYAGKLGQKVASGIVTVLDDGTLPQKRGTNRIDDEGSASSKVVLIEKGVLKGFLHSLRTAKKMDMSPTGNGRRESFRHMPIPRMRNTLIAPGETPPGEIIASIEDGILITDMGGGEVDIVTGNFMFHCSEAYRIRNGAVGEALRDVTLTGRGPDILTSIDMVGSDLGFNVGTCGKDGQSVPVADAQPTLRIPAIVVGGASAGPDSGTTGGAE
jgi:TldD protein